MGNAKQIDDPRAFVMWSGLQSWNAIPDDMQALLLLPLSAAGMYEIWRWNDVMVSSDETRQANNDAGELHAPK